MPKAGQGLVKTTKHPRMNLVVPGPDRASSGLVQRTQLMTQEFAQTALCASNGMHSRHTQVGSANAVSGGIHVGAKQQIIGPAAASGRAHFPPLGIAQHGSDSSWSEPNQAS